MYAELRSVVMNMVMERVLILLTLLLMTMIGRSQGLPTDGPLTIRPLLQQLGERLLKGADTLVGGHHYPRDKDGVQQWYH